MENVKIPEEINLQEVLKIAEAVSCDYECSKDYTLHLFKKKDGLIGWLERKIANIESGIGGVDECSRSRLYTGAK